ncbi:MAG: hypothetical protein IT210_22170 [Armatimonadetes bacterium]|nr:hypothetical protein [Armatimonadota bacterium]
MQAIHIQKEVEVDGEVTLKGLPYKKGQRVELIVVFEPQLDSETSLKTVGDLLESGLVGIWKDRVDIGDSVEYARHLREEDQSRDSSQ